MGIICTTPIMEAERLERISRNDAMYANEVAKKERKRNRLRVMALIEASMAISEAEREFLVVTQGKPFCAGMWINMLMTNHIKRMMNCTDYEFDCEIGDLEQNRIAAYLKFKEDPVANPITLGEYGNVCDINGACLIPQGGFQDGKGK